MLYKRDFMTAFAAVNVLSTSRLSFILHADIKWLHVTVFRGTWMSRPVIYFTIWAIPLPLLVDFIFTAFKMEMVNLFLRLFISIIMTGSLCIYCMLTVCVCQSWIKLPQIKSTQCNYLIWYAYEIELLYLKSFDFAVVSVDSFVFNKLFLNFFFSFIFQWYTFTHVHTI